MSDADILARAAAILAEREKAQQAEVGRLYTLYARKRARELHNLGKPKKLSPEEALLLAALERNHYKVETDCPNGNRWHGDATCAYHVRGSAIMTMATSRVELLWSLWAAVSDQPEGTITLTEKHLRGSVIRCERTMTS